VKVLKFGGSSVANAERIRLVKNIVLDKAAESKPLIVVVSALGGVTDALLNLGTAASRGQGFKPALAELEQKHIDTAKELLGGAHENLLPFLKEQFAELSKLLQGILLVEEISPRLLDSLASKGELLSSYIIAQFISKDKPDLEWLDSRKIINTDSNYTYAKVNFEKTNANISSRIGDAAVYLMGGFIASNDEGTTTTLGRGGSDYSAAIMAAGANAEELEIWTDVNGVMTADPRKVKKAYSIDNMTYVEAMEMSHFGAKVIHPPTIQPVLDKQIPIRIKNTFEPEFPGTFINAEITGSEPVKGISSINEIALVNVSGSGLVGMKGFAGRLFNALGRGGVNIVLITQASSEHSICFATKPSDTALARKVIESEFELEQKAGLVDAVEIDSDLAIVAMVGANMKNTPGISGRMMSALGKNGINIYSIAQGSSELNISVVIHQDDVRKAVGALHQTFFDAKTKTSNLFFVGIGLIGGTLLKQIEKQRDYLKSKHNLEFNIIGIANSRQMLFDENGIDINTFDSALQAKGEKADLSSFVDKMIALNLPNSIFVENTASQAPIEFYNKILDNSISITTANKVANSGSMESYRQLRDIADKRGVKLFYETNVGAGLPVINSLNDLLRSGDDIVKIEAVLSGSLSFIFNSFTPGTCFCDIVKLAKEKGYTEPDPRDDLSGKDVARKALILCREMGLALEMSDIKVENILPQACADAPTVEAFFEELEKYDLEFDKMRDEAKAEGKVLRLLATIENGEAAVGLKAVGEENPFHGLQGADNMISFTTSRYNERPLVVKGPGAGAEVTAAGVFAEIITISKYLT